MKPDAYQLVSATGYDPYTSLVTLPGEHHQVCGLLQEARSHPPQGIVDYAANPGPANVLIVKLVADYNKGWEYSAGEAAFAAQSMVQTGSSPTHRRRARRLRFQPHPEADQHRRPHIRKGWQDDQGGG